MRDAVATDGLDIMGSNKRAVDINNFFFMKNKDLVVQEDAKGERKKKEKRLWCRGVFWGVEWKGWKKL